MEALKLRSSFHLWNGILQKKTKQEYCSIAKKENKMKYNKITLLVH